MDQVAGLRTFVAVAVVQNGGFSVAARHLSVAPSTVPQQIQALEQRMGARDLHRIQCR
jgi:DNA-binding transcriptional LysR family regulator